MKNQITVRGLDAETEKRLGELARQRHISLNKAAIVLIRKGAGLRDDGSSPEVVAESLDSFVGTWSREEETQLLNSIRDMDQIDTDLWQ